MRDIEVRLRHADEAYAVHLGTTDDIESVVPLLTRWGVRASGDGETYHDISGQFCQEDGKAYFEVILGIDG